MYGNRARDVTCEGRKVSLKETCHSKCNFIPKKTLSRDSDRSFVNACEIAQSTCVEEKTLCQGEIICENDKDLKWCKDPQRSEEDCDTTCKDSSWCFSSVSRCGSVNSIVVEGIPGQCIANNYISNNNYECFDRSDESPFSKVKKDFWVDVQLKVCHDETGWQGFECTNNNVTKCETDWCSGADDLFGSTATCDETGGKSIRDKTVCGNTTLWQSMPCEPFHDHYFHRCQGRNPGQCIPREFHHLYKLKRSITSIKICYRTDLGEKD